MTPLTNRPRELCDEQVDRHNALNIVISNSNNDWIEALKIPYECDAYRNKFIHMLRQLESMCDDHFSFTKAMLLRIKLEKTDIRHLHLIQHRPARPAPKEVKL